MSRKTTEKKEVKKIKAIVKPKEEVTLLNTDLNPVHHYRPTVVLKTDFITNKIYDGVLEVIASNLPEDMNDEDFEKCYNECEKDEALAIEVYLSEFSVNKNGEKVKK